MSCDLESKTGRGGFFLFGSWELSGHGLALCREEMISQSFSPSLSHTATMSPMFTFNEPPLVVV